MRKTVKLADVLWTAANKHLAPEWANNEVREYSCEAVAEACGFRIGGCGMERWENFLASNAAITYLRKLGVNPDSGTSLDNFRSGTVRQGGRYMWLLLAMHVAEDEGIEIEVNV